MRDEFMTKSRGSGRPPIPPAHFMCQECRTVKPDSERSKQRGRPRCKACQNAESRMRRVIKETGATP